MMHLNRQQAKNVFALILIIGLGASVGVYVTAEPPEPNPLGYDPMRDRKYLHDLEMYGGKANVMAAQFREWFASLWQGQALAATLAILTLTVAGIFWWFTIRVPEPRREN